MSTISTNSTNFTDEMNPDTYKIREFQNIRTSNRLNGNNYHKWSQLARTYLKGKERLSHLLGTGPTENDPKFEAWDEEDSMIMTWLWDSMDPMISDACMSFGTTREIWEYARRTYSKANDTAKVYEIKVKIPSTKQEGKFVTDYASMQQNL